MLEINLSRCKSLLKTIMNTENFLNAPLNSIVRVENTRTLDALKDQTDYGFYIRERRVWENGGETWVGLSLEHPSGYKILLVEISIEDVRELRVYQWVEGMELNSREQLWDGFDWIFEIDENELDSLGDLDFTTIIEDSEGNIFDKKKKNEVYEDQDGYKVGLIEYSNVNIYPPELLIIEEGTLNDNGGMVEFLDGDIIEDFDISWG